MIEVLKNVIATKPLLQRKGWTVGFVCGSCKIHFKLAGDVSGFNQHFRLPKSQ